MPCGESKGVDLSDEHVGLVLQDPTPEIAPKNDRTAIGEGESVNGRCGRPGQATPCGYR